MVGANPDYTAWSYNLGTSSWAWAFVVADSSGSVITYGEAGYRRLQGGGRRASAVQSFSTTFTLKAPTTVDFTLRDYYVPDNGGGVALDVAPVSAGAAREHSVWALILVGFLGLGVLARRIAPPLALSPGRSPA